MARQDVELSLRALRLGAQGPLARAHVERLREALSAPWMEGAMAGRILAALSTADVAARWEAPPLRVGETWLLVGDPARQRGEVLRWRATGASSVAAFSAEGEDALARAWLGLTATLAEAHRTLPVDLTPGGFEVPGLAQTERIDGASLGVAACLGWLSRALGTPPPESVAASAMVRSDGSLGPVTMLPEKVAALGVSAPRVTHLLVARGQSFDEKLPETVTVVRCATLAEAIARAGFALDALPERTIEAQVALVEQFRVENSRQHGVERWRALSAEAWSVGRALLRDPWERVHAAQALTWAALFALHAGDDVAARELVQSIEAPDDPMVRLWKAVVGAAVKIDRDLFDEAVADMDAALGEAHRLGEVHRWIEGHARGTRGRALLHGGRHAEAWTALDETVRWFHDQRMPWEAARTANGAATCLRLTGHAAEALMVVNRALVDLATSAKGRAVSVKTSDYLRLERGRCLLAIGRPAEALESFERVLGTQSRDHDYPRLGALRGTVVAHRRLGQAVDAARGLDRCRAVALACPVGSVLGRVAAMATAEALVDDDQAGFQRALDAWARHRGECDEAAMRTALEREVY